MSTVIEIIKMFNGLSKVDFDQFDGVIGFVNEKNRHWKFVVSKISCYT